MTSTTNSKAKSPVVKWGRSSGRMASVNSSGQANTTSSTDFVP